jgi:hypothetical protein
MDDMITNYDWIRNLSIDDMAKLFYHIAHERDLYLIKKLKNNGIDASLIEPPAEILIAYHRQYLSEEWKGE